jgi:CBS domain-containing protein
MVVPAVSHYMTVQPWTIERTATIAEAQRIMMMHDIRHLPILDDGELCGVVCDHDLLTVEDPGSTLVHAVMTERPFVVTGDTPLDEVAAIMSEHRYGSAIIAGRNGVEGIFTVADACRVLADVLQRQATRELTRD